MLYQMVHKHGAYPQGRTPKQSLSAQARHIYTTARHKLEQASWIKLELGQ